MAASSRPPAGRESRGRNWTVDILKHSMDLQRFVDRWSVELDGMIAEGSEVSRQVFADPPQQVLAATALCDAEVNGLMDVQEISERGTAVEDTNAHCGLFAPILVTPATSPPRFPADDVDALMDPPSAPLASHISSDASASAWSVGLPDVDEHHDIVSEVLNCAAILPSANADRRTTRQKSFNKNVSMATPGDDADCPKKKQGFGSKLAEQIPKNFRKSFAVHPHPNNKNGGGRRSLVHNVGDFLSRSNLDRQVESLGLRKLESRKPNSFKPKLQDQIKNKGPTRTMPRLIELEDESQYEPSLFAEALHCIERFEDSSSFSWVCSSVILMNAVFLAWTVDYQITHVNEANDVIDSVELCLLIFYTWELCVRFAAQGWMFWNGPSWAWNWFDMLLVASAVQEQVLKEVDAGGANMSYLRVARLLKMLKIMRVIRIAREFRELRLVLDSIMGSVKSMLWSMVLVATITFMFGVCFTQAIAEQLSAAPEVLTDEIRAELFDHFGSVGTSMLALFMAVTNGIDWRVQADPLRSVGSLPGLYFALFLFYIAFFMFVVMNSLTSIFVDSVREYSERDHFAQVQDQLRRKKEYMNKILSLYDSMDVTGQGHVTNEQFCQHMSDPEMIAFSESLDIEATDLQQFFNILSAKGTRTVDVETFVVGCIKLRGTAKAMDVVDLLISHRESVIEFRRFARWCEAHLAPRGASPLPGCRPPQRNNSMESILSAASHPEKHFGAGGGPR